MQSICKCIFFFGYYSTNRLESNKHLELLKAFSESIKKPKKKTMFDFYHKVETNYHNKEVQRNHPYHSEKILVYRNNKQTKYSAIGNDKVFPI